MIHARDLGYRYPAQDVDALAGVTLETAAGQVTWITGELGSGTSTFLMLAAGLAPRLTGGDRRGRMMVDGLDPSLRSPPVSGIAYLSAAPALQLSGIARTVRQEIAIGPMNLGWTRDRIEGAVSASITRFGIAHLAERVPSQLSGGETQRVMFAALDATSPRCWLLDEPFSALDHATRRSMGELIRTLANNGAMVVVASDDADAMLPVAERLVVFRQGRCVLDGPPGELLAGDSLHQAGAGSTDTATLARAAGIAPPRPLTPTALLGMLEEQQGDERVGTPAGSAQPDDAVHFDGVTFRYSGGLPVLTDTDARVPMGVATGLFGANGAGKSTILRLCMALEHPVGGTVRVLDTSTAGRHPEDLADRVGFLFQQPERQLFATTVRAECGFSARLAGWERERIAAAVARATGMLGLDDSLDLHPGDLPLPRRRMVALAALLVTDPVLLLLDEPTAGLDAASRDRVVQVVRARTLRGLTTIAVTHDHLFAHEALDRAFVVAGHVIRDVGSVDTVLDGVMLPAPAALQVARRLKLAAGSNRTEQVAAVIASRIAR